MAIVISTEDLKEKLDSGKDNFHLIDALSEKSFAARHIPGAANVPSGHDFLERFEKKVSAEKDEEIIVYCASNTCQASVQASRMLEEAGYTNVVHYKDGLAGWKEAGYEFEGA